MPRKTGCAARHFWPKCSIGPIAAQRDGAATAALRLLLLEPHVVIDRLHTVDAACDFDCLVYVGLVLDEAA